MATIDHVTIRTDDLASALELYSQVFELLGFSGRRHDGDYFHEWNDFSISRADEQHLPTHGLHVAFAATSRAQVDGWWRTLTTAGYRDDGPPGPRPQYSADYYGAFIRDHDDNSVEAVHHRDAGHDDGLIDHLWIRVADLDAARRFYEAVSPHTGFRLRGRGEDPTRFHFRGPDASFSVVDGTPTEHVHVAFGASDKETVGRFYRAGLEAGGRDNGAPGERPQYHDGYYGAYLLDPDGNNVEVVFHDRRTAAQ